ncbi:pleckstrin homology domain-containing family B member 2-like [Lytechinus variegatus]|uniref:pleckstrin homology domain-containing family B member 2-like n=1 Tax=Lytechinus variegatus TaxID=7654 RepID=UPI001BB1C439|nr:pleckstrin homology domain-containing family B member 2-like [Lytechinus variegatus]XP_041483056.1 pleckstrin homology domain-containing family B member 2-like [Lytechinus variegatus]
MATSAVAANHHVVKAGWMQRESDVLRRWKSCYCILKTNGMLSYFNDEKQKDLQGQINLPRDCFVLKIARDVTGVTPPSSHDILGLIEIRTSQANTIFCADSADDAQTWKLVFDDVIRANRVAPNAPHGQQPPVIINGTVPPPCYAAGPAPIPPQVVSVNPPPVYTVNPSPVTVINPGSTSRVTSTTYYPNGQSVTQIQRGGLGTCYPVQQTVYTYPGQTIVPSSNGTVTTYHVPNQTTTRVYQTRYY